MKFRKKPVVVEAIQFDGSKKSASVICRWANPLSPGAEPWIDYVERGTGLAEDFLVHTLEGEMRVYPGDWVIKGIKGECYPCKPDIFEATYEPVEEAPDAKE